GLGAASFEEMYDDAVDALLSGAARDLQEAAGRLKGLPPRDPQAAAALGYPKGPLGHDLAELARLIKADVGVHLGFVEVGGWDHHVDEGSAGGRMGRGLTELGAALSAFRRDLGPRADETLLVTMTEFGRTAQENGNRGTDHGHGSVMMLLGGGVRGGRVYGNWPGLSPDGLYQGRDLAVTTDFRQVLHECLADAAGLADERGVFPGFKPGPGLGLFA
ncbi:MAG: DUF1501 domain-containing protein, partial [Elusimicrobia bacterium]|nr:DUF1501 domain-containing protein [Elusimicrobiota bacterium]